MTIPSKKKKKKKRGHGSPSSHLFFRSHFLIPKALHWDEFREISEYVGRVKRRLFSFSPLSLFSVRNQLNSHLGRVRSWLTSISMADNDFNTPPVDRTHHMFHTIRLSPAVAWAKPRGTNPQIEQRAKRVSSPPSLVFTFGPKAQRN